MFQFKMAGNVKIVSGKILNVKKMHGVTSLVYFLLPIKLVNYFGYKINLTFINNYVVFLN